MHRLPCDSCSTGASIELSAPISVTKVGAHPRGASPEIDGLARSTLAADDSSRLYLAAAALSREVT